MILRDIARGHPRQKGAVLIISLLLLVVITLIGVTAMQTTTLDTKIAGNYRNYKISFEGAEAALTEAQSRLGIPSDLEGFSQPCVNNNQKNNPKIWNLNPAKPDGCNLDQSSTNQDPWWFQWDWTCWKANAIEYSDTMYVLQTGSNETAIKPLYLIEDARFQRVPLNEVGYDEKGEYVFYHYYRITARGNTNQNGGSDVMLQAIFAWHYGDKSCI